MCRGSSCCGTMQQEYGNGLAVLGRSIAWCYNVQKQVGASRQRHWHCSVGSDVVDVEGLELDS